MTPTTMWSTRDPRPLTIGYLSYPLVHSAWQSPSAPADPAAAQQADRLRMFAEATTLAAQGIEDVVAWGAVEVRPGVWDWSEYRRNATEARARGLDYIPFIWPMITPRWVRDDPRLPRATCLEHGEKTDFYSIFSDWCMEAYDRFYAALAAGLGDLFTTLRIASPYDFGETAYPAGPAQELGFPLRHMHCGFWVAEPEAQAHLAAWLQRRYQSIGEMRSAWGTDTESFAAGAVVARPDADATPRLDFLHWYHEAFTERMAVICRLARKHFPTTRVLFNLGWPYERPDLGQDIPALLAMAHRENVEVRVPTGPYVPFVYTLHARAAAPPGTVTSGEPADMTGHPAEDKATAEGAALRMFKDLGQRLAWYFDFAATTTRYVARFGDWRELPDPGAARVRAAVLFSRTDYWLRFRPDDPGGYPHGLLAFVEGLRAHLDVDVLDDRQVAAGALSGYEVALWPLGFRVEEGCGRALRRWLDGGGRLVVGAAGCEVVGGSPMHFDGAPHGASLVRVLPEYQPVVDPAVEEHTVADAYDPTAGGDLGAWGGAALDLLDPSAAAAYRHFRAQGLMATETEAGWVTLAIKAGPGRRPGEIAFLPALPPTDHTAAGHAATPSTP